jgi:hypothetical protein
MVSSVQIALSATPVRAVNCTEEDLIIRIYRHPFGTALIDKALAGDTPLVAINSLSTECEWSEQRGFANLIKDLLGTEIPLPTLLECNGL